MIRAFLTTWLDRFERTWGYDASYMRQVLAARPASAMKFALVSSMASPKDAPPAALAAAGIAGTMAEDCGPCAQLGVDMAIAGGVAPAVVRAIVAGDEAAMGEEAAIAWRFARASLARDLTAADAARDAVVTRFGERGLVALSLALTASRMYPTLKYALGYGRACSRLTVAGEPARRAPAPALAA